MVVVAGISAIGSSAMTFILGLLCGMKYMPKKIDSKQSIHISEENVMRPIKGPVYEEVELEDKTTNIDLLQNIAYEQVKKTAF